MCKWGKLSLISSQETLINYSKYYNSTNLKNKLVGGKSQEWKTIIDILCQKYFKQIKPQIDVEEMGELANVKKKLNVEQIKNPYILNPTTYKTQEQLFEAIEYWWIFKKRKNKNTVKKRLPTARRMSKHPVYPINWQEINQNQIIAYLEYREYSENAGKNAIRNEWDIVNMFACAYGISTETWGYTPPSKPPAKVKIIPLPNTTHNIIQNKYSKDKYTNSLYQYILLHGFLIGWRPSELVIQKASDINIEEGYMIITETKKHNQLRQIFPEQSILVNPRRKSLKNWIDKWRPKVENQYSKDYLYLQPNGRPYTVNYLRKQLTPLVKEVWKPYCLYTMRHWCATARLIKSKVETNNWDIWEVKDWMGHDKLDTTENYVKYAKKYHRNAPFDWIKSVLKHYKIVEENRQNSKNPENTLVSGGTYRSNEVRTRRDSNPRSLA
jgi:integrase